VGDGQHGPVDDSSTGAGWHAEGDDMTRPIIQGGGITKRQAEVAGGASVHGVDGEAAGLIGCFGKEERLERHGMIKNPVSSRERGRPGEEDFGRMTDMKKASPDPGSL
jgi:hypothetical protein